MSDRVWAAVALKSPATAKSRLSRVLGEGERRQLYFIMAHGVISSLKTNPNIERVVVVASGREVAEFAIRAGADVIRQDEENGTAAAFACAVDFVKAIAPLDQPDGLLMIAGDLPLISPAAVSLLLDAGRQCGVCIVPDRQQVGTNALLCSPPDLLQPCFGNDSFARHCAAAREQGIVIRVHESPELSLDIDVADDLALLGAHLIGVAASSAAPMPLLLRGLADVTRPNSRGGRFSVEYG